MAGELPPAHGFSATQELLWVKQEKWALGGNLPVKIEMALLSDCLLGLWTLKLNKLFSNP